MLTKRAHFPIAALPGGRLLLSGGGDVSGSVLLIGGLLATAQPNVASASVLRYTP